MESIIGKQYKPFDNSYGINITKSVCYPYKVNNDLLTFSTDKCTIISEPFKAKIPTFDQTLQDIEMVMVEHQGHTHMVIYDEGAII